MQRFTEWKCYILSACQRCSGPTFHTLRPLSLSSVNTLSSLLESSFAGGEICCGNYLPDEPTFSTSKTRRPGNLFSYNDEESIELKQPLWVRQDKEDRNVIRYQRNAINENPHEHD